jgi:DNA-binding response OmpR family regulator
MARILVVDDEKPLAETLATILRMNNYEVQVAHDGVEGYNAAALFAPNLIISDVAMPNRNGVEMAIEIRRDLLGIQILLISGQATTVGLLEAARQRGYDFECLAKPIHPLDLLNKIATLLTRSAAAKQAS